MICPICGEYCEDGCFNPDCVESRSIRENIKMRKADAPKPSGTYERSPSKEIIDDSTTKAGK